MSKTILEQYIGLVQEMEDDIDPATTGTRFQVGLDGEDEEEISSKKKQILIKINRLLRNRQISVQNLISELLDSMDNLSILEAFQRVDELELNDGVKQSDIDNDEEIPDDVELVDGDDDEFEEAYHQDGSGPYGSGNGLGKGRKDGSGLRG